jgi:hypothetical protein
MKTNSLVSSAIKPNQLSPLGVFSKLTHCQNADYSKKFSYGTHEWVGYSHSF